MKKTLFIFTMIVVIVVGARGIWAYRQMTIHRAKEDATQVTPATTATTTLPQIDATANWKTYTNDKYGIELKYPADLNDIKGSPYITLLDVGKYGKKQDLQFYFTLFTVNDSKSCSADTYTQILLQDNKNATRSEIKLADSLLAAWRVEGNSQPFGNTGEIYISSKNCGYVFRIESGSGPLSSYDKNLFDEILKTIRFTNVPVADKTAGWKTYTNDEYKFSFEYPASSTVNVLKITPNNYLPVPLFSVNFDFGEYGDNSRPELTAVSVYEKGEFFGKYNNENVKREYDKLVQNYDSYLAVDKGREMVDPDEADAGPYNFKSSKLKISGVPALSYCVESVGGFERSIIFEKSGFLFRVSHGVPCSNIQAMTGNGVINFEHLLSSFNFKN